MKKAELQNKLGFLMFAAVVVVGILFKGVMVGFGEVGEDEFETDFEDDEGDEEGDVGFDVDAPSEVEEDGGEDGEGDEHVI